MVKLLRIDDRLLHGQIAFTWVPALGIDCLMIVNNSVAQDDFLKMTFKLAKPPAVRLIILGLDEAIQLLRDEKTKNLKILVLVNSISDASILTEVLPEVSSVNFGGLRSRESSIPISKAISITEKDRMVIESMLLKGLELEVRQVPTDKKQLLQDLIK